MDFWLLVKHFRLTMIEPKIVHVNRRLLGPPKIWVISPGIIRAPSPRASRWFAKPQVTFQHLRWKMVKTSPSPRISHVSWILKRCSIDFLGTYNSSMDVAGVLHEFSTKSSWIFTFTAYPDHIRSRDLPKSLPRRDLASPPLPENPNDSCGNLRSQRIVSVLKRSWKARMVTICSKTVALEMHLNGNKPKICELDSTVGFKKLRSEPLTLKLGLAGLTAAKTCTSWEANPWDGRDSHPKWVAGLFLSNLGAKYPLVN